MMGRRNGGSAAERERAKELRRAAYRKAKEARDRDPRYIAMKQAAKERRRETYQAAKERHKAATAGVKARAEVERAELQAAKRATFDKALMELVRRGTK